MQLFLHIRLIEDKLAFYPTLEFSNVKSFDIDNFSSAEVISTALNALDKSDKVFVLVDNLGAIDFGSTLKIIRKLKDFDRPVMMGYHDLNHHQTSLIDKLGGIEVMPNELKLRVVAFFSR